MGSDSTLQALDRSFNPVPNLAFNPFFNLFFDA